MKVHFGLPERRLDRACLTIGTFDGVHRGHAQVVKQLIAMANEVGTQSAVLTFDPHPRCVLAPDACPPMLTTVDEKVEALGGLGVDHMIVFPFNRKVSLLSPTQFVDRIWHKVPIAGMVIGYDFAFGHQRRGNREFLEHYGASHRFGVGAVQPFKLAGGVVSSSNTRRLLLDGMIPAANRLLGREYSIATHVETGTRTGHRIGYPTANLAITPNKLVPKVGVYAVWVDVGKNTYAGAMNIGYRPTFGDNRLTVEVYLLDFKGNLYRRNIRVRFVRRLRDERRFSTVDALVAQIDRDVARTRAILRA